MLIEINESNLPMPIISPWTPSEEEVEQYIFSFPEIRERVFKEDLFLLKRQLNINSKRCDILAVDAYGNGVIIELKRDNGGLGVDTQALQYLAAMDAYKGPRFVEFVASSMEIAREELQKEIMSFTGRSVEILNKKNRIILIAKSFDPALFSMGRWLESKGIGFKCIQYQPVMIENRKFLNFSVAFSASPFDEYSFHTFQRLEERHPSVYWHNIGIADPEWWSYIQKEEIITTSYENLNDPICSGYKKLHQYIKGDGVVAFASKVGAIGYGVVKENPSMGYSYKDHGISKFGHQHFHRLKVEWLSTVDFDSAISTIDLKEKFSLHWPTSTKKEINNPQAIVELRKTLLERQKKLTS